MTTLTDFITRVRYDLRDTDPEDSLFSDESLHRHIMNALRAFSTHIPREVKTTLITTSGSRDISITSLSNRISIEAVEYPVDQFPKEYVRFSLWQDTLTLLTDSAPTGSQNVYVYWTSVHLLDPTQSTVPTWAEDILSAGAVGFAAGAFASASAYRHTPKADTARAYSDLSKERLNYFYSELKKHGRFGQLRTKALYTPAESLLPSQSTDPGP